MTVLSLRFCARAFSSCSRWGPLFIAVRGPLAIAASLVAEHRLQTRRLSNCGSRAQSLRGMWDLPRPGLEPMSPALAGRFSTTAPPGKPTHLTLLTLCWPHSIFSLQFQVHYAKLSSTRQKCNTVFHCEFLGVWPGMYQSFSKSSGYLKAVLCVFFTGICGLITDSPFSPSNSSKHPRDQLHPGY